jgi:hypothetical protein
LNEKLKIVVLRKNLLEKENKELREEFAKEKQV